MKKKVFIGFVGLLLLLLTSCLSMGAQIDPEEGEDEDEDVVELITLDEYEKIVVKGPFNIILTDSNDIDSNMKKNFLKRIEFVVEDGILQIIPSRRFFPSPSDSLDIYLGVHSVTEVTLQVDGILSTRGILRGEMLKINLAGNVRGLINSDIDQLYITSHSPGRIVLVGNAKRLETRIYSKSLLSLKNFRADEMVFHNEYGSQVLMPR